MRAIMAVMWCWTWDDPVLIIYSIDSTGKMTFHEIKPAPEIAGS